MPETPNTVSELFDQAIQLEKAIEKLYRQIGRLFTPHQDVAQFRACFAEEEYRNAGPIPEQRGPAEFSCIEPIGLFAPSFAVDNLPGAG